MLASVVLLALLDLPRLKEAGFPNALAAGLFASSGRLAILFPPSVMLIVLSDANRTAIETTCADISLYTIGVAAAAQQEYPNKFRKNTVTVARFPDSVLDALQTATAEVYAEK